MAPKRRPCRRHPPSRPPCAGLEHSAPCTGQDRSQRGGAQLRPPPQSLICKRGTQLPTPLPAPLGAAIKRKQRRVAAAPTSWREGSDLPVQGLLPLWVLNPQGAQNRIHQRLVLEDDPPEAVQEWHGGGPRRGRTAAPSAEAGTPRGRVRGRGPGLLFAGLAPASATASAAAAAASAPRRK